MQIFCLSSTLQEQKGELRKRLSYTTHKLEMLETEFDSTRQYLEVELRRAQEELEKVTEKLRRLVVEFTDLSSKEMSYFTLGNLGNVAIFWKC